MIAQRSSTFYWPRRVTPRALKYKVRLTKELLSLYKNKGAAAAAFGGNLMRTREPGTDGGVGRIAPTTYIQRERILMFGFPYLPARRRLSVLPLMSLMRTSRPRCPTVLAAC